MSICLAEQTLKFCGTITMDKNKQTKRNPQKSVLLDPVVTILVIASYKQL